MISQNFLNKLNLFLNNSSSASQSDQCLFNASLSNNSLVWKNGNFEEISKTLNSGELSVCNEPSAEKASSPVALSAIMLSSLEKIHNGQLLPSLSSPSKAIKLESEEKIRVNIQSNGICDNTFNTTTDIANSKQNKKTVTFLFYLPLVEKPTHLTIYAVLDHPDNAKESLARYLSLYEHNNLESTEPHTNLQNLLAVSVCKLPENLSYPPGSAGISNSFSTMLYQDDIHVLNQVKAIQDLIQQNVYDSVSVEMKKRKQPSVEETCAAECNNKSSFNFFYQCDPVSYSFNGPNHRWLNRLMRNLTTF